MIEMTVSKKCFLSLAERIKKINLEEIPFSLIVGSLFPLALKNIEKALQDEHMKGYIQGKEEILNENSGNHR